MQNNSNIMLSFKGSISPKCSWTGCALVVVHESLFNKSSDNVAVSSAPAVMLNAEHMNIDGACLGGMLPLSWMHFTVSGRSPGQPIRR